MDYFLFIARLGDQLREKRIGRGLTQAQLADLAGLTRYKVIAVEKGTFAGGMIAYARRMGALDCVLGCGPAALTTHERLGGLVE